MKSVINTINIMPDVEDTSDITLDDTLTLVIYENSNVVCLHFFNVYHVHNHFIYYHNTVYC